MRKNFAAHNPGAFVTADADEFPQDFTRAAGHLLTSHGRMQSCLQAGKHVMSEVTSFFSMAEGVAGGGGREQAGLQPGGKLPFSAANMWLASRWKEGLFGELTLPSTNMFTNAACFATPT